MKKFLVKQSWKSIVMVWVMELGLVTGVQLVKVNLDNRSKATDNPENAVVDIINDKSESELCGSSDGLEVLSRPVADLCASSSAVWIDSVGLEGVYKWYCVSESGETDECYAFLTD